MTATGLDALRDCLEGGVPSVLATCAPDGTPNITYVSQVEYVDRNHVALSFQFFNKTRENILANPQATVIVTHPRSAQGWRLQLRYLRTESAGPLFERMKAKLAGVASHTGMAGVFRLQGADVYRVAAIEALPHGPAPAAAPAGTALTPLRRCLARLDGCTELEALFDECLSGLAHEFSIERSLLLASDAARGRLYAVASRGFPRSGIGSEIDYGDGVIGVAARERTPIRLAYSSAEYAYGRAVRRSSRDAGLAVSTEIPFPGRSEPQSQLAVPLVERGACLGVLYVESDTPCRYGHAEEDLLCVIAAQLAARLLLLRALDDEPAEAAAAAADAPSGAELLLRRYCENDSLFVGDEYLIKGVAGAILWKLLCDHASGRSDFCSRELRLDPALRLPDVVDNLDTRLILLRRRLAERCPDIAIDRTGRGRYRLRVARPLRLQEISRPVADPAAR